MFFDPALDLVDGPGVLAIINSALVAKLRVMVETDRLIVLGVEADLLGRATARRRRQILHP